MSIFAEQTIDLNLTPGGVLPVVHVSQYDSGYQINFRIFDGSQRYDIPTDVTVRLDMTKTDGQGVSVQATKNNAISSMCYVWLTLQMTTCVGDNECELVFVHRDDERRIGTVNFILQVEQAGLRRDAIVSESQISIVQDKLDEWGSITAYGDALDAAVDRISDAESDIHDIYNDIDAIQNEKAPKNHASSTTDYGVGTQSLYGHLKLWEDLGTYPPTYGQHAIDASSIINFCKNTAQAPYYPSHDASAPGWAFGWRFVAADSRVYCRMGANWICTVTFTAKVGDIAINAGVSSSIITNLPAAATRIYVQAYFGTYVNGTITAITPVMCAIRPENTDIDSPARTLQIDGPTNPVQVPAGALIFGTFTYVML